MDDIVKSIKAFLYDRTVSPLFGAYASAWCLWNYRIFVALLDDDASLSVKMDFIDSHFGAVTYHILGHSFYLWGQIVHGLFGPLLLTLFYLFVYPWLAKPVYAYSLKQQKELREAKQAAEELRLLSPEESRNLTKEIEQLRQKADADEQFYRKRIASLTETINALESNKGTVPSSNQAVSEHSKATLSLDEVGNLVRSNIESMPNGEFQLSDLFKPDAWQKIDESIRKEYGKLFRKLVERGDFDDVSISRKGSANQLIYLKNSGSMFNELHEFEHFLSNKIHKEYFPKIKELDQQLLEQLNKIADYCVKNHISKEMLEIFMEVVLAGAEVPKDNVARLLSNTLSPIEIDVVIDKLKLSGLLTNDSFSKLKLSSKGKEMAVESGLTVLDKTLSK